MITVEELESLAGRNRTPVFPNIVREYFQHLFLSLLYQQAGAESLLFKGGTALRIVYGSPRFSEDLDFSLFGVESQKQQEHIETLFAEVLVGISRVGPETELGPKLGPTRGGSGYFGTARFQIHEFAPVSVEINVQAHPEQAVVGKVASVDREFVPLYVVRGAVSSVTAEFVPTYTLLHLPQDLLVGEKLDALVSRKKARDFYDLYFIMRRGLLSPDQKRRIAELQSTIEHAANEVDVATELSAFLPADQHALIKDFPTTLRNELRRQLGVV